MFGYPLSYRVETFLDNTSGLVKIPKWRRAIVGNIAIAMVLTLVAVILDNVCVQFAAIVGIYLVAKRLSMPYKGFAESSFYLSAFPAVAALASFVSLTTVGVWWLALGMAVSLLAIYFVVELVSLAAYLLCERLR